MITNHAQLLKQVHEYVDEYIKYLGTHPEAPVTEANDELRRIIGELEKLQSDPDQQAEAARLSNRISDQLGHLNILLEQAQRKARPQTPSRQQQTLAEAFRNYLNSEVDYLMRAQGKVEREQTSLLLSDVIADLKALALHPNDEQALQLAADLEVKREQLRKLQRPWQQAQAKASS